MRAHEGAPAPSAARATIVAGVRDRRYEGLAERLSAGRRARHPDLEAVAAARERAREEARWRWEVVQDIAGHRRLTPEQLDQLERWLRQPPDQPACWRPWA